MNELSKVIETQMFDTEEVSQAKRLLLSSDEEDEKEMNADVRAKKKSKKRTNTLVYSGNVEHYWFLRSFRTKNKYNNTFYNAKIDDEDENVEEEVEEDDQEEQETKDDDDDELGNNQDDQESVEDEEQDLGERYIEYDSDENEVTKRFFDALNQDPNYKFSFAD